MVRNESWASASQTANTDRISLPFLGRIPVCDVMRCVASKTNQVANTTSRDVKSNPAADNLFFVARSDSLKVVSILINCLKKCPPPTLRKFLIFFNLTLGFSTRPTCKVWLRLIHFYFFLIKFLLTQKSKRKVVKL